jgi:hypothetical protein
MPRRRSWSRPRRRYSCDSAFRRLTVKEATAYAVSICMPVGDRNAMVACVREHEQTVQETDTWDDLFFKIFLQGLPPWAGMKIIPFINPRFGPTIPLLVLRAKTDPPMPRRTALPLGILNLRMIAELR